MLIDFTRLNEAFGINEPLFLPEDKTEYTSIYVSPRLGQKHSEETKKIISASLKTQNILPPIQAGKKWWYNNDGDKKLSLECPGSLWSQGRPYIIAHPHTEETKQKMSEIARARCDGGNVPKGNRGTFTIQHPCGKIERVKGAKQWCLKHDLNYNSFKRVMRGIQKHYKGYSIL